MVRGKIERLMTIKRIIVSEKITCQEELLVRLSEEGFNITQATLSRDIKELKIAKIPDSLGRYTYKLQEQVKSMLNMSSMNDILAPSQIGVESLEFSGQMAVIKTEPGYASVVASIIDNLRSIQIMGTIAGDDTVLLILREGAKQMDVVHSLKHAIPDIGKRVLINKL